MKNHQVMDGTRVSFNFGDQSS